MQSTQRCADDSGSKHFAKAHVLYTIAAHYHRLRHFVINSPVKPNREKEWKRGRPSPTVAAAAANDSLREKKKI